MTIETQEKLTTVTCLKCEAVKQKKKFVGFHNLMCPEIKVKEIEQACNLHVSAFTRLWIVVQEWMKERSNNE